MITIPSSCEELLLRKQVFTYACIAMLDGITNAMSCKNLILFRS